MTFQTLTNAVAGRIATITLNRLGWTTAISLAMPGEIAAAVDRANRDDGVHVIVLTGAGDGFCSSYDLKDFAEAAGEQPRSQLGGSGNADARPWDPMADFFGITRHSPEGVWFKRRAEEVGFKQAVRERDWGEPIAPEASRPLAGWARRRE